MIDICCNLTHAKLNVQLSQVLERALQAGVHTMIVTASDVADSGAAIALANQHTNYLWASVGTHPHHAEQWNDTSYETLRDLAIRQRVVAIGETGLDYYRNLSSPKTQQSVFVQQIELAIDTGLPLFMHQRDAHEDFIKILKPYREHINNAVVHCFTGNRAMLEDYLALDLYIGVTGWICDDRRAADLRDAIAAIPDDRLLLETDAPYLIPRSLGKSFYNKPNEPAYLPYIAKDIAQRRKVEITDLIEQTINNSYNFYGKAIIANR